MFGFTIGVVAAFFWSITNIIDKHLVTKYSEQNNIGGILLLSCFFPLFLAGLAFLIVGGNVFSITLMSISTLFLAGVLMVGWIYYYLQALQTDDASIVMALLVLAPIFSLGFGLWLLQEFPNTLQLIACGILISGALVITYQPSTRSIKWKLLYYTLMASLITGLMHSLFKITTVQEAIWESLFWRSVGMGITGIFLFVCISRYRLAFTQFIQRYLKAGTALHTTNESLTLLGDTLFAIAILFAPLAIIQTTEAYQPLFVFVLVYILGKLGFTAITETHSRGELFQKICSFLLMLGGTYLLIIGS